MSFSTKFAARLARAWMGTFRWKTGISRLPAPGIYCVWHRDVPAAGAFLRGMDVTSLVSRSRDGGLLVEILSGGRMGFARGSSSSGAIGGTRTLLQTLESGRSVATTWDGPRGPAGTEKPGPRWLSARSKAPLATIRFRYGLHFRLRDWSRMRIPLPFSSIRVDIE